MNRLKPTSLPKNGGGGEKEIPGFLYYLCAHITSTVEPDDRFSLIFFITSYHCMVPTQPTFLITRQWIYKLSGGAPLLIILYFVDRAPRYNSLLMTNLTHFFLYLYLLHLSTCFFKHQCSSSGDRIVLIHHLV